MYVLCYWFFFHSRVLSCVLQQHMWVTFGSGQWNCCPHSSVRLFIVASAECTRSVMRVLASDGIWKWPWSSQIKLVHSDVEIDSSNIPNYSESFALLYLLKSLFIQIKSIPYPGLWWQLRFFFSLSGLNYLKSIPRKNLSLSRDFPKPIINSHGLSHHCSEFALLFHYE